MPLIKSDDKGEAKYMDCHIIGHSAKLSIRGALLHANQSTWTQDFKCMKP